MNASSGRGHPGGATLARARALLDDGHAATAAHLLATTYLDGRDPNAEPPDPLLGEAAGWYAIAVDGDPATRPDPRLWAGYALAAAQDEHLEHLWTGDALAAAQAVRLEAVGAEAMACVLDRAGQTAAATTMWRSAITASAELDGVGGARGRRRLLEILHRRGRCAEAEDTAHTIADAAAALDPAQDPDLAHAAAGDVLAAFLLLESCHRHNAATELGARVGQWPGLDLVLAIIPDHQPGGDTFDVLQPDRQHHTASHHHTLCDRPSCPGGGASDARFLTAVLSAHDPATAPADRQLVALVARLQALTNPADHTVVPGAAWARYRLNATLALPDPTGADIAAAARAALATIDDQESAAVVELCRPALTWLGAHRDYGHDAEVRFALARHLHRHGACDQARHQAHVAHTSWLIAHHILNVAGAAHFIRWADMLHACHDHRAASAVEEMIEFADLDTDPQTGDQPAVVDLDACLYGADHAHRYHRGARCTDLDCVATLANLADISAAVRLHRLMDLYEEYDFAAVVRLAHQYLIGLDPRSCLAAHSVAGIALCYVRAATRNPDPDHADDVVRWARYAQRTAADLGTATAWARASTALAQAATVHGRHSNAIGAARHVWHHYTSAGPAIAAANAQRQLAIALHGAGRCAEGRRHAYAALRAAERVDSAEPDRSSTIQLAELTLGQLLFDCHRHRQSIKLVLRPKSEQADDPEHRVSGERTAQMHAEVARGVALGRQHRAYHSDDPCRGDVHKAAVTAVWTRYVSEVLPPAAAADPSGKPEQREPGGRA